jgi:hypothetical protein
MESAVLDEVMDEFLNDDSINKKVRSVEILPDYSLSVCHFCPTSSY